MKHKILRSIICLSFILCKVLPSFALTTNWAGTVSTAWETAGNWSDGVVPLSTTDVIIGNVSFTGTFQPTITAATTVKSISLGPSKIAILTVGNNTLTVTGNITISPSGTLNAKNLITCVTLTVSSLGVLKVNASDFTSNYNLTTLSLSPGSIVEYSATSIDQTISSNFAYSTLRISGSGSVKSLIANLPPLQAGVGAGIGQIDVQSGTLDLSTFLANRGATPAGGTITVSNGAFLKIGGTNGFPANYFNPLLLSGSTVEYNGTNQQIFSVSYGDLLLSSSSGAAVKTMPATAFTIKGSLTSAQGPGTAVFYTAASNISVAGSVNIGSSTTFGGGTFAHSVTGSWNNNGGAFIPGSSTITLNGGSSEITGNPLQAFYNLAVSGLVNLNNSDTIEVQNVTVNPGVGASLILSQTTLRIAGAISVSGDGNFDASNGTIEMNGTVAQSIPALTFFSNAIDNLIISNSSVGGVVLNGAVDILGSLTYSAGGTALTTNDFLTLKSTLFKTARIGDVTGKTITGKVTVERYLSAHKAWYFLSVPTNTSQTVKTAWQEGATGTGNNPLPGYGTQITSNRPTWSGEGFDLQSVAPSMKSYNPATGTWAGILNTNTDGIKTPGGYMIFVRGERTADNVSSDPTETVLRTMGNLFTGNQDTIFVNPDMFVSIGNPYASPLDMRNIITSGLKNFFYVWDPQLSGINGFGGYQTFSKDEDGEYVITPGGGSYTESGSISNYLASGTAFLTQAESTGGYLVFTEASKSDGVFSSSLVARRPLRKLLRTNLYGINTDNSTYMVDGVLNNYSDIYNNGTDGMDAIKLINTSENLSIQSEKKLLVIERRHNINEKDTIFLNLANTRIQHYRFQFTASQLGGEGLSGFLEDTYLHTSTALDLDGTSFIDFSVVNIPGSYAVDRFRIIFKPAVVLACSFSSIKACQENKDIAVEWKVENEVNIKEYQVEKSKDGRQFTNLCVVPAKGNGIPSVSYLATDTYAVEGYNYYRIKSVSRDAKATYTDVVKVLMGKGKQAIIVYPNPVINNVISIQLNNMPAGKYGVKLLNGRGQKMLGKIIQHAKGSSTELIALDNNLPHGVYQLQIVKPGNEIVTNKLVH